MVAREKIAGVGGSMTWAAVVLSYLIVRGRQKGPASHQSLLMLKTGGDPEASRRLRHHSKTMRTVIGVLSYPYQASMRILVIAIPKGFSRWACKSHVPETLSTSLIAAVPFAVKTRSKYSGSAPKNAVPLLSLSLSCLQTTSRDQMPNVDCRKDLISSLQRNVRPMILLYIVVPAWSRYTFPMNMVISIVYKPRGGSWPFIIDTPRLGTPQQIDYSHVSWRWWR